VPKEPEAPAKPPIPAPPQALQVVDAQVIKACPFCGEAVLEIAKKCRHCGEIIDITMRAAVEEVRRAADPGRGDVNVVVHQSQAVDMDVDVRTGQGGSDFPHLFHIIMCLLTCGLWLPIYALHGMLASRGGGMALALLVGIPTTLLCAGCIGCGVFTMILPHPPQVTPTNSANETMKSEKEMSTKTGTSKSATGKGSK
jgi:hypothetical protein